MMFSIELTNAEFKLLQAHQKTMGAKAPADVLKAALAAFQPPAATTAPSTTTVAAPTGTGATAPLPGPAPTAGELQAAQTAHLRELHAEGEAAIAANHVKKMAEQKASEDAVAEAKAKSDASK